MTRAAILVVLVALALLSGCDAASITPATQPTGKFFDFYATNLRASLFSGCLTLGSFLLAVNTFLIVNLKKEVFEHDLYKQRVKDFRKDRPDYAHYGPLRNLSRVLLATIVIAFVSAVLQLTMGMFWRSTASAMVCIWTAIIVGAGVFVALVLVAQTMKDWFDFLEAASLEAAKEPETAAPEVDAKK